MRKFFTLLILFSALPANAAALKVVSISDSPDPLSPPIAGSATITGTFQFSPKHSDTDNGGGSVRNVLQMNVTLSNSAGTTVRSFDSETSASRNPNGPDVVTASIVAVWNGLNNSGVRAPDGTYTYSISGDLVQIRQPKKGTSSKERIESSAQSTGTILIDSVSPQISALTPAHASLISATRPQISAAFSDPAPGSGINLASVKLMLDGANVTAGSVLSASGLTYTPTSDLAMGVHALVLTLTDLANNAASSEWSFQVDPPPAIFNVAPADGTLLNTSRPTLSAGFSDPNGGVDAASAKVLLDGSLVAVTATAAGFTFTPAAALSEGAHSVDVEVSDTSGNKATAHWSFSIDSVSPQISALTPANASLISAARPQISAAFTDPAPGSGINPTSVSLMLDGADVTASSVLSANGISYTPANDLAMGAHTIVLTLTDAANNTASSGWSFLRDLAPTIANVAPADGSLLNTSHPTLSAEFSDPNGGVDPASAKVLLDGSLVAVTATAAGFTFTPVAALSEGAHSVDVEVSDTGGNKATAHWSFSIDSVSPQISALTPANASNLSTARPLISAAFSDPAPGSGIYPASVKLMLDGADVTASSALTANGISFTPANDLAMGAHTVVLTLTDAANNTASSQWSFLRDLAPAIANVAPADGSLLNTSHPTLSAEFSDPNGGVDPASTKVLLDGSLVAVTATAAGFTFTPVAALSEGAHSVDVEVSDTGGNKATAHWSFSIDSVSPQISALTPANASLISAARPQISAAFTDPAPGSGINPASVSLMLDGADVTASSVLSANGISYTPANDLAMGAHTVVLTLADAANNTASSGWSFLRDLAPTIANVAPADGSLLNTSHPTLSAEFSDPNGGVDPASTKVLLDGSLVAVTATAAGFTFTPAAALSEGAHSVDVEVSDTSGNKATAHWSFSIDSVSPQILALTPANASNLSTARPLISAAFSDPAPGSGINPASVSLMLDGADVTASSALSANGISYTPANDLAMGAHTVVLTLTDAANNTASSQWSFLRDLAPTIANVAPADGSLVNTSFPTLSAEFSDPNGGVDPASAMILLDGYQLAATTTAAGFTFTPVTPMGEGTHTVDVEVSDTGGNKATAHWSFSIDSVAPQISAFTPADASLVNAARPQISAAFSDPTPGSGINPASVKLMLDGADVTAGSAISANGISYTPANDLAMGAHTVVLTLADAANNTASSAWSFLRDQAPTIANVAPADGSLVNTSLPTLSAEFSDPNGGVDPASTRVLLDGAEVVVTASASGFTFTPITALGEGAHSVDVEVSDTGGNQATAHWSFTVDSTGPAVQGLDVSPASPTNNPRPLFSGQFLDLAPSSGISPASVTVLLDGAEVTAQSIVSASGFSFTPAMDLNEGGHTLAVMLSDFAGNPAHAEVFVEVDLTPPPIPVIDHVVRTEDRVTVSGESTPDVVAILATADGAVVESAIIHSFVVVFAKSGNPTFDFTLRFRDRAGNIGLPCIGSETFQESGSALQIASAAIVVPSGYTKLERNGSIFIKSYAATVSFALSGGTAPFTATVNGQPADTSPPTGNFFVSSLSDLPEGELPISIVATDAGGQSASRLLNLVVDRTGPIIHLTSPTKTYPLDGLLTNVSGKTFPMLGTITDEASGPSYFILQSSSGSQILTLDPSQSTVPISTSWSLGSIEGIYFASLFTQDALGNTSEGIMLTAQLDRSGPPGDMQSPDPERTVYNAGTVDGWFSLSDYPSLGDGYLDVAGGFRSKTTLNSYDGGIQTFIETHVEIRRDRDFGEVCVTVPLRDLAGNTGEIVFVFEAITDDPMNYPNPVLTLSGSAPLNSGLTRREMGELGLKQALGEAAQNLVQALSAPAFTRPEASFPVRIELGTGGYLENVVVFVDQSGFPREMFNISPIQVNVDGTSTPLGAPTWVGPLLAGRRPISITGTIVVDGESIQATEIGYLELYGLPAVDTDLFPNRHKRVELDTTTRPRSDEVARQVELFISPLPSIFYPSVTGADILAYDPETGGVTIQVTPDSPTGLQSVNGELETFNIIGLSPSSALSGRRTTLTLSGGNLCDPPDPIHTFDYNSDEELWTILGLPSLCAQMVFTPSNGPTIEPGPDNAIEVLRVRSRKSPLTFRSYGEMDLDVRIGANVPAGVYDLTIPLRDGRTFTMVEALIISP